jgi:hypothetical protein
VHDFNFINGLATKDGCRHVAADKFLRDTPMQSVQPDSTNPIAIRQSAHGVGTLLIRFVGLLTAAVVVMALIWSS